MSKVAIKTAQAKTVAAGTRVALAGAEAWVGDLTIKALSANTKPVYIGDGTVSAAVGRQLTPGEVYTVPAGEAVDLSTVYLDSEVNAEGVSLAYHVAQR